jgi:DNA-binding transcriptional ArsR family regulator
MAVTVELPETFNMGRVNLAYDALSEAAISLHVLADPKHHPLHAGWVRRTRSLSPQLRQQMRSLLPIFKNGLPGFLCPTRARGEASIDDGLERLVHVSPEVLFYEIAYKTILQMDPRPATPAAAMAAKDKVLAESDVASRRVLLDALQEPGVLVQRMRSLLYQYWDEAFRDEWLRIRATIDGAAEEAGRTLLREGMNGLLRRLHPEVMMDTNHHIAALDCPFDFDLRIDPNSKIMIYVSFYIWPHVWVSGDAQWPLAIAIPTVPPRLPPMIDQPQPELIGALRALADPVRLNLLRLIAAAPRSTQELAQVLHMSEPGISRHLTTLARSGLVHGCREGHYVVYAVNEEGLAPLSESLLGYISP